MYMTKKAALILAPVCLVLVLLVWQLTCHTSYKHISPLGKSFSAYRYNKQTGHPSKIVYGYLPYWSLASAKYVQFDKLTDIAYFGLKIQSDGNFKTLEEDGSLEPGYQAWKRNEDLTKLINSANRHGVRMALTIISHEDAISDRFLSCRSCWQTLATNLKVELKAKNITHVNVNFEYVELVEDGQEKKYTEFVRFLNAELDKEFGESFVVVAAFADSLIKPRISDVEGLAKAADGIFIMAYDFHQPNSENAGPVAPINGKGVHSDYDIKTMLTDYLAYVPPNKLLMGVPYYGNNWVVTTSEGYAERIEGNDFIGYSQSQRYADIMDSVISLKPRIGWDELGQTPYFSYVSSETGSLRQVYFDNKESLRLKYRLVKEYGLGGVGIWALGYDGGYLDLWDLLEEEFND